MTEHRRAFPVITELYRIGKRIAEAGGRPVLVGGWVRDCLLGIPHSKDFDVEVFGMAPGRLKKELRRFGPVHAVGRHFGVLKLVTQEAEYDVSVPRRESKIGKGHKGFHVEADPAMTFEMAAARRDFTMNAMGYAFLDDRLLDPYGGQADLERGILRHVGPAFGEDPLRVLRAMQFAGRFALDIAPETLAICREQDLHELPRERMWVEFKKLLLHAPRPSDGLRHADALGVLPYFPELEALYRTDRPPPGRPDHRPWTLTLATVDEAATRHTGGERDDVVLMTAAMVRLFGLPHAPADALHDPLAVAAAAEQPVWRFMERLTNETELTKAIAALVRELPLPQALYERSRSGENTDPDVRRLALRVSIPFVERLARAAHDAAQRLAGGGAPFAAGDWLLQRAEALGVSAGAPRPLVQGRDLLALGMQPGPHMGRLLQAAYDKQLDGDFPTRKAALEWLRQAVSGTAAPDAPRDAAGEGKRR